MVVIRYVVNPNLASFLFSGYSWSVDVEDSLPQTRLAIVQ